jgi:DNA-binding response OmpR family regulator
MSDKQVPFRVLLIEDDHERVTSLATLLLVAGYEVEMAFDSQSAIETAESFRPDVCLVDLNSAWLNIYDLVRCFCERIARPPFLANVTPFSDREAWDSDAEFDVDFTRPSDPVLVVRQLTAFLRNELPTVRTNIRNTPPAKLRLPEPRQPVVRLGK